MLYWAAACVLAMVVIGAPDTISVRQLVQKEAAVIQGRRVRSPPTKQCDAGSTSVPKVCVVIRTYHRQINDLRVLLYNLLNLRDSNLFITVLDCDFKERPNPDILEVVQEVNDCRVQLSPTNSSGEPFLTYGYFSTDRELDRLQARAAQDKCEYYLFTNGDNLYNKNFLKAVTPAMLQKTGLIAVNFVSGHFWPQVGAANVVINARLEHMHVDLGSVLVKANLVGNTRFLHTDSTTQSSWDADWVFFEQLLHKPGATSTVVPAQVLFYHQ